MFCIIFHTVDGVISMQMEGLNIFFIMTEVDKFLENSVHLMIILGIISLLNCRLDVSNHSDYF